MYPEKEHEPEIIREDKKLTERYFRVKSHFNRMICKGQPALEQRPRATHVLLMDDDCCSIGSANLDHRSLSLNFETNVMVYSEEVTSKAADQFLRDLEDSTEYLPEQAEGRPLMMRVRMAVSRQLILLA